MTSKKQYTAEFTSKLFKHSVGVLIIVLALLLVSKVSAEEISVTINPHPESNEDSLSKQQQPKAQIYIVSGTVTTNLVENSTADIAYVSHNVKKKNESKKIAKREQKKVEKTVQNPTEKSKPINTIVRIYPNSSSSDSFLNSKNSRHVIVTARDYRLKIIEYSSGVELSLLINSKILQFGYYKSLKVLTSKDHQSHVRPPPPQQYYYFG